jgi:ABC-2 type transport system ATP-binding protein
METVEALCDHIALINHAELILQGEVNEIRKSNRTHVFEMEFLGNLIAFTNALWTGFELIDKQSFRDNHHKVQLKIIGNNNANSLFQAVMPHVEILGFREVLPTMNEIFINTVSNAKN